MLEVRDLHKSFRGVHAVRGVSFQARDGEVTGLIGPNGAGKTTILRMLYTVLRPDSGTMLIDGVDAASDRRAAQRRIGVLPDVRGLYPRLTAREHVRYFGRLHGMRGAELESRIDRLIALLDMREFADRKSKGFSRGQQMKVALARALVHEPHNVMLDEPTNGLDVATSRAVRQLIGDMRAAQRCVLFSSHIMQEVAALCDRIVILAQGRVVLAGTPDELRRHTGLDDLEEVFMAATGTAAERIAAPDSTLAAAED
ncbi:MAG: ATP-binding cassette domain-containing protein [Proteobacteria bacterium]|nr:ATP-binding cassette domain-containing protein [Pseudomonadota bacterium]